MRTDSQFVIGQAHVNSGKPCQDYAMTGELTGGAFAIVSDGCSSGGETDIGARMVALATAQALRRTPNYVPGSQQTMLQVAQDLFGITREDMLATCLYAVLTGDDPYVRVLGDGVVAIWGTNGDLSLYRYEWTKNAPVYPIYASDNYAGFRAFYDGEDSPLRGECWSYREGAFELLNDNSHDIEDGIAGITIPLNQHGYEKGLAGVAVFSDGVTQVENIDWKDAVLALLDFKSTEGLFAKRRMNGFIKAAHKLGRGPIDDIAYAVILKGKTDED